MKSRIVSRSIFSGAGVSFESKHQGGNSSLVGGMLPNLSL